MDKKVMSKKERKRKKNETILGDDSCTFLIDEAYRS